MLSEDQSRYETSYDVLVEFKLTPCKWSLCIYICTWPWHTYHIHGHYVHIMCVHMLYLYCNFELNHEVQHLWCICTFTPTHSCTHVYIHVVCGVHVVHCMHLYGTPPCWSPWICITCLMYKICSLKICCNTIVVLTIWLVTSTVWAMYIHVYRHVQCVPIQTG